MKKICILLLLLGLCTIAKAQYIDGYNPYLQARLYAQELESQYLDNVRFDENILKENPEVWNSYLQYLELNERFRDKQKKYLTVAWIGAGVMAAAAIPLLSMEPGPTSHIVAGSLMIGGSIAASIGVYGAISQSAYSQSSKKDFIYYLKTSNNGIGIVTLF